MSKDFDFDGAVPPWGRSAAEYEAFFALSDVPPSARILDCGSGPSSFAAEWGGNGRFVVAADPMYRYSARGFLADFDSTAARMLAGMRKARDRFKWDYYGSPEDVVRRRRDVLTAFVADLQAETRSGRYVSAGLPNLPFLPGSFDLVLCSHLLFLYSAEFDTETHLAFLEGTASGGPRGPRIPIARHGWQTFPAPGGHPSGAAGVGTRRACSTLLRVPVR